jgi:hypothetical protein
MSYIDRHCLLRSDKFRRWIALTDAKVIVQGRGTSIRSRHRQMGTVAFDLARRIAGRARHIIAFVRDMFVTEFDGRGLRVDGSGCRRAVAVQYQISLHLGSAGCLHELLPSTLAACAPFHACRQPHCVTST